MDWPTEDICKYFSSNHWIVTRNQLGGLNAMWHCEEGEVATVVVIGVHLKKDRVAEEGEDEEGNHDYTYFCFGLFVDVNVWK